MNSADRHRLPRIARHEAEKTACDSLAWPVSCYSVVSVVRGETMAKDCEAFQPMMSAYLDGELSPAERTELEQHLASCEACKAEFEKMKRFVNAASDLQVEAPAEEVWDRFLDGVYNRLERQTGWLIFIVGAVALTAYGVYVFVVEPWGSALVKLLIAAPVVGLVVVFASILRERLSVAKTDRYSKEIEK